MTAKEIRVQIRETRKEMRAKGIKRISCFNGGLHGEVYSLNARMFDLETKLLAAKERAMGKKGETYQIVLARIEEDFKVIEHRRTDLGERPLIERFDKPVACMWVNAGTQADIEKANAYAKADGYTVFIYPRAVRDPLGQAKRDIVASQGLETNSG